MNYFNYERRNQIGAIIGLIVIVLGAALQNTWIVMFGWLITVFSFGGNELA